MKRPKIWCTTCAKCFFFAYLNSWCQHLSAPPLPFVCVVPAIWPNKRNRRGHSTPVLCVGQVTGLYNVQLFLVSFFALYAVFLAFELCTANFTLVKVNFLHVNPPISASPSARPRPSWERRTTRRTVFQHPVSAHSECSGTVRLRPRAAGDSVSILPSTLRVVEHIPQKLIVGRDKTIIL